MSNPSEKLTQRELLKKFNEFSYLSLELAEMADPIKGDFTFGEVLKHTLGIDSAILTLDNIRLGFKGTRSMKFEVGKLVNTAMLNPNQKRENNFKP